MSNYSDEAVVREVSVYIPASRLHAVFGQGSFSTGDVIEVFPGVTATLGPSGVESRSITALEPLVHVVLSVSREIAIGVFSAWLYDRLKGASISSFVMRDTRIEITRGEIERIMIREIEGPRE